MEINETQSMAFERQEARSQHESCRGLRGCDRVLEPGCEPPLGAHMITPRRGYLHHAIYVGGGRAVHYGGLSWGLYGGPVEEVPLSHFSQGRPIWVRVADTEFEQHEVVRRARLRLGEDLYSVLTNNCEHFCEWCVRGKHRSYQIEDRIVAYARVLLNVIDLVARNRRRRWQSATADLKKLAAPRNVVEHRWNWLRARYTRQRKLRREACKL